MTSNPDFNKETGAMEVAKAYGHGVRHKTGMDSKHYLGTIHAKMTKIDKHLQWSSLASRLKA
jgi:hypothetical protein